MKYTGELSAIRFEEDDLHDIQNLLLKDSTEAQLDVNLKSGEFTYEYETADEILADTMVPDFILSYEFVLSAKEGRIRLTGDHSENEVEVWINGDADWVRNKKDDIDTFFKNKGDWLRTQLHKYWLILAIAMGAIIPYGYDQLVRPIDDLSGTIVISAIAISLASGWTINKLYPYTMIAINPNKSYRPNVKRLARLIAFLGGLLTIIIFLLDILPRLIG